MFIQTAQAQDGGDRGVGAKLDYVSVLELNQGVIFPSECMQKGHRSCGEWY